MADTNEVAGVVARLRECATLETFDTDELCDAADLIERLDAARVEAERELAKYRETGCPYCLHSAEGTSYCTLAESTVEAETRKREAVERERDELRARIEELEKEIADENWRQGS